jgi:alkylhydroperoxidase family enzyme
VALGRSVGLDEAHLAGLGEPAASPETYTPVERVIVYYSHRLTRMESIDDELFGELRRHFSVEQVMELCFIIGISNMVNRFHATFHTPLDERTRAELAGNSPLPLPPEPPTA